MKRILLVLGLLLLVSGASAYDTTLNTQALGTKGAYVHYSPYYIVDHAYYLLEYPGVVRLEYFANCSGGSPPTRIEVLNITEGVASWENLGDTGCGGNTVYNFSSNTGLIYIHRQGGFATQTIIQPLLDNITWVSVDYSWRNFSAGGTYQVPYVSSFYPNSSSTSFFQSGSVDGVEHNINEYVISSFTPNCAFDGLRTYTLYDTNFTTSRTYNVRMNINALVPLNISMHYPSAANVSLNIGAVGNFSVVPSDMASTDAITWYLNGGLVYSTPAGYFFNHTFSSPGTYLVEAQLENWACGEYPTVNWTVVVGSSIALSGKVFGVENGVTSVLSGAQVSLVGANGFSGSTTSFGDGEFSFMDLAAGSYTLSATKSGYNETSLPLTLSYHSGGVNYINQDITISKVVVNRTLEVNFWLNDEYAPFYMDEYAASSLNLTWNGLSVVKILNGAVVSQLYPDRFEVSGFSAPGPLTFGDLPDGDSVCMDVSFGGLVSTYDIRPVFHNCYTMSSSQSVWTTWLLASTVIPMNNDSILNLDFPSSVSAGECYEMVVNYQDRNSGEPILNAYCSVSSAIFEPSSITNDAINQVCISASASAGNYSYTVSCFDTGHTPLDAVGSVYCAGNVSVTTAYFVSKPSQVTLGDSAYFSVRFWDGTANAGISGGSCSLDINGGSYPMVEGSGGVYSYYFSPSVTGSNNFSASCSKSGFQTALTGYNVFSVVPYVPPTTLPSGCSDGFKDGDETDVDCGGSCGECDLGKRCSADSDCVMSYCKRGVCTVPSCSDNILNGDEFGIDCGGTSCPACLCLSDWDCAVDGSERCVGYACQVISCSSAADCPAVIWSDRSVRSRECKSGFCRFVSQNVSGGNLSLSVSPLSGLFWNKSSSEIYLLGYCEDSSNGVRVSVSPDGNLKAYMFLPSSDSPAVSASSNYSLFGDGSLVNNLALPELCLIPEGQDRLYGNLSVFVSKGRNSRVQQVNLLTFREKFKGDIQKGDSGVVISLNRVGSCYEANGSDSAFGLINGVPDTNISYPGSDSGLVFFCNDSFGEKVDFSYGGDARSFFLMALSWIGMFLGALWTVIFGGPFKWEAWMIALILPLSFLFAAAVAFVIFIFYEKYKPRKAEN